MTQHLEQANAGQSNNDASATPPTPNSMPQRQGDPTSQRQGDPTSQRQGDPAAQRQGDTTAAPRPGD
ncbi:hypothetical protein, partial [Nocardia sp. CC201C]|uniref:hypothetical protein n=1 Tax=Nocardia sp. CC201C TaxID=3044575 RepID=UPI0024A95E1F